MAGAGYLQARKVPGMGYRLFYAGTRNEPFPNMFFKSVKSAYDYFKKNETKKEC